MTRTRAAVLIGVVVVALAALGALIGYAPTTLLGLLIPVGLLLGAAVVAAPEVAVIVYAMLRPVVDAAVFVQVGGLTLGTIWGAGFVVVLAAYWLIVGFRRPLRGLSWMIPVSFVAAYALFAFGRGDLMYTLSTWIKIGSFVVFALTCEQIAGSRKGQWLIQRSGVVIAVLTLVVMGIAIATNQYGAAYYAGQTETVGQGPHGLASMGVLSCTFLWIGAMFGKRKWLFLSLAAIMALGVTLSLVRTTLLAFAVVALWYIFWGLKTRSRGALALAVAVFGGMVAGLVLFQDQLASRVSDLAFLTSGGGQEFRAGSGRLGIWAAVLQSATANAGAFLLGRGPEASFAAVSALLGAQLWAHNDFLELLVTGGILLLLLYLAVVGWLFASTESLARDAYQSDSARAVGRLATWVVVAFIVMGFFNGIVYFQSNMVMAMVIGLTRGMMGTPGKTYVDEKVGENAPRLQASPS